jgi:hypothetical protein
MSDKVPRYSVGDTVCERSPSGSNSGEVGTVVNRYEYGRDYRYVVKFESSREEIFFEKELLAANPPE